MTPPGAAAVLQGESHPFPFNHAIGPSDEETIQLGQTLEMASINHILGSMVLHRPFLAVGPRLYSRGCERLSFFVYIIPHMTLVPNKRPGGLAV